MNEFNIRKDLPSVKVDKELINQLEEYILSDVADIIGVERTLLKEKYSLKVEDSLGVGKFNSISEFPLSLFQDGTKELSFGFSIYSETYCSLNISFSTGTYSSKIDVSLKTTNPREKAQGIYNGMMDRINQHKTYNFIFHKMFVAFIGGAGIGMITPILILIYRNYYLWASVLTLASLMIIFTSYYGPKLKPYSEFMTKKQIRYNRIFSFFIWGCISYLIFGLGFGILKESITK